MFVGQVRCDSFQAEPQEEYTGHFQIRVRNCALWVLEGDKRVGYVRGPLEAEHRGRYTREFADDYSSDAVA